ncbi:MAG: metallophosphoesterase family protein [Planctomycetota bacterium]|jgi:hypothetical protein
MLKANYAETFRFTVYCDHRPVQPENIPRWEWLLDEMSRNIIDEGVFHIMPGDFEPPRYTDASLKLQFGEDVVWYPVVGNHELDEPAYMEWIRNAYYSLPYIVNQGPAGCETTTYSWDYGNAHFVALNQYYDGVSDTGTDGDIVDELYYWLVADLEANTKPVVFIFGHEPAYPEYRHVGDSLDQYPAHRDRFWKLLNDEQVIAYFCCHTHHYYAKRVDGDWATFTWQVDVGNAGNPAAEASQTFMDVTVTNTEVIFNTWQGMLNSPFTNIESWTVGIPAPSYKAYRPKPADGAVHPETWAILSWTMGASAVSHAVYFGENFDDVNDGTGGTFQGNQTETSFAVGSPESAYPQALVPGVTYYWRVDEVNDLDPNSPWKGDLWSFTVSKDTAYNPSPADGALCEQTWVELQWSQGKEANSHYVYFGDNFDDVNDGTGGTFRSHQTETVFTVGLPGFPYPGGLAPGTTYYWRIDEVVGIGRAAKTLKGDVWSFILAPGTANVVGLVKSPE